VDRAEAREAKRLYVHPAYRRRGLAIALLAKLIDVARAAGYRSLYGDTMPSMTAALVPV
jgi:GNAT superfamily N-acetyltransferase